MKTAIVILAFAAVAAGQRYVDPKQAAILQEARYLSGDGSFGAAYNQEDGIQFKEETDADGNRRGQYSYIGDDGKPITVSYTAGKNGFQVSGDHLPRAPLPPPGHAPAPQYAPQPQYNAIPQQASSYKGNNNGEDGQYRPDLYETPYQYNNNLHTQNYPSQRAPANNQAFQNYHNALPAQQTHSHPAPVAYTTTTTPSPNRFFPPGKLNLNRTPDGFQYTFASN